MSYYDENRVPFKDLSDDEKRERIAELRDLAKQQRQKYQSDSSDDEGLGRKSLYLPIGDSINEFKYADGAGEKAVAGAKVIGKSLFNIGRFTMAELLPNLMEQTAKQAEKSMKK